MKNFLHRQADPYFLTNPSNQQFLAISHIFWIFGKSGIFSIFGISNLRLVTTENDHFWASEGAPIFGDILLILGKEVANEAELLGQAKPLIVASFGAGQ